VLLTAQCKREDFRRETGMHKLGVGVLGVGEMGRRHAENLRRLIPEARLVAVADIAATRARQVADELEIEHSFGCFEDMLAHKDVNCVVIAGTNEDEVVDFARFARDSGYEVRFIEYMPLDAEQSWERAKVFPSERIVEAIDAVYPLIPEGNEGEPASGCSLALSAARQLGSPWAMIRHALLDLAPGPSAVAPRQGSGASSVLWLEPG